MMKSEITYFEEAGFKNTVEALELAKERAIERGIKTVAIASIRGGSAGIALDIFKGTDIKLIMCTCNACHGCDRFSKDVWKKVKKAGHTVACTQEDEIPFPPPAALAYRRICQGMKVGVQLAMSLADQEIVEEGEDLITVTGTGGKSYGKGWGLDTAIVIEATRSDSYWQYEKDMKEHKLHSRKVKEIICMPR